MKRLITILLSCIIGFGAWFAWNHLGHARNHELAVRRKKYIESAFASIGGAGIIECHHPLFIVADRPALCVARLAIHEPGLLELAFFDQAVQLYACALQNGLTRELLVVSRMGEDAGRDGQQHGEEAGGKKALVLHTVSSVKRIAMVLALLFELQFLVGVVMQVFAESEIVWIGVVNVAVQLIDKQ